MISGLEFLPQAVRRLQSLSVKYVRYSLSLLTNVLERCVGAEKEYVSEEFLALAKKEPALTNGEYDASKELLKDLWKKVQSLEKAGINGIWSRIIKNAFAPVFVGKFDFVAGNPPWVNWENLPQEYREVTSSLWQRYGLAARSTSKQFELGKMRRDLSMLFTYACSDAYLLDGGTLGFLITQMVFKTQSGEVFRKFPISQLLVLSRSRTDSATPVS